jgi:hypothetical protein
LDVGLNGQRDSRIAPDVAQLHVVGKVAGHDLVPVPADVDAGDLWGAVRVDGALLRCSDPGGYRADPTRVTAVTMVASARRDPRGTPGRPLRAHPSQCT